jgi:type VI protein secretion system component VasF
VVSVTELTDWERRRLDALGRQLAKEDPRLAARLTGSVRADRRPAAAAVGWAMLGVGVVLLVCGAVLGVASTIVMAVFLLSTSWVVLALARRTGGGRSS